MNIRWIALSLFLSIGCRMPGAERESPSIESEPQARNSDEGPNPIVLAKFEETRPLSTTREMDDALGLAATCIEKGDSDGAAEHLNRHIKVHPEQIMIRAYLAELCFKMKRLPAAQYQFEQFIAEAQNADGVARKHVLHCHTRLMEIAQDRNDEYAEHLHRGIGMVLLARQLDEGIASEESDPSFRERILCKASAELTRARKLRVDEPRPCWYLFEVWTKLDQPRSAEKALRQARALAALLPLPPAEGRALALAR